MQPEGDDSKLLQAAIFFAASKNRSYREMVTTMLVTLVTFLEEHGLTSTQLLPPGQSIDQSFVLRRSDLTEEGREFYRRVEQPWLKAIDRGGPPSSTRVLNRVLRTLRPGSTEKKARGTGPSRRA